MENKEIIELLRKYDAGHCNDDEKIFIETWYIHQEPVLTTNLSEPELEKDLKDVWSSLPKVQQPGTFRLWYKITAVAVILIILGTFLYFYTGATSHAPQYVRLNNKSIKPGGNHAILTLANGSKIALDVAVNGEIAEQSGISIEKTEDGQLIYKIKAVNSKFNNSKISYNTIETPKGGRYQVNLPDGTKVWLNSASSLRYPIVFANKQRLVELNGEAYFEVAHNKAKPFRVLSGQQQVEVLGTHFDINNYADEPAIKTTLLEGSVKVIAGQNNITLKPNQQSILQNNILKEAPADLEEVMAWKNGDFVFKNENIESIMRKLARWYDVEVVYEGDFKNKRFEGSISQFKDVAEVLRKFELTGSIYFKIEGRKIIVMK